MKPRHRGGPPPPPRHTAPGVEMEEDLPSGDSLPINPRNSVNTTGSASESHLEQWRSSLKPKKSLENVTCAKSIGDSKMNFGKMQEFASANAARYKTTPTKAIHALPTLNGSVKTITNVDLENATIQKQRNELQLLVVELKDRDKELNEMVAAHQKQLLAWEEDRMRILGLEERCAKVEHELRNRNEMIRNLSTELKILESQHADCVKTLNCTQQKLKETSDKAAGYAKSCEELEDKNKSLNSSVMELSAQVGQLQAREQELTTMLELKDKDMVEASNHIMDLTARFKTLEGALREARLNETNSRKEVHDCKQHSKKLRHEICKLRDELDEKTVENNEQREEIIRLKQERQYLGNELTLAVEREKRKDQILELARSKQERADTELHGLRQVNEKQQHDLQLLQLNLESSQELIQSQEEKILEISSGRFFSQNNNGQNKGTGQEHQNNMVFKKWTKEPTKDFKTESITNRHVEAAAKSTQNLDAEFIPVGTKEQGHLSVTEDRSTLNCRNYSSSDFANGDCANGQVPLEFDQYSNACLKGQTKSLHCNTNEPNKHPTKYVESKQDCRYTRAIDCGSPQGRENDMQPLSRKQKWRVEGSVDGSTMEHENVAYMNTDHRCPSCGTLSHCKAGAVSTSTDNHHSLCSKLSATSVASTKELGIASENRNLEDKYSNKVIECGINEEMPPLPAENETDLEASMSEQNWMKLYERAVDVKDMWWLYLNDGSGSSRGLGTPIGVEKKSNSDERPEVNAYGLESPLHSKNPTPVREMPRRKSSLHDELCVNDSPARLSSAEDNTMMSSNNAYRDDCSPTSKLQRLLAESRQMVASLDRGSQLPLGLSSCPTSNSNVRDGGSL